MAQQYMDRLTDSQSQGYADQLGGVFASLPHLPKNITEILVKVAPFFALLGAIFGIIGGPLLGIASAIGLLSLNPLFAIATLVAAVLSVVSAIILFMAYKPLKDHAYNGWMLLFWAEVISLVELVIDLVLRQSGSIGGLIGIAIGFYVLYEIRPFYGWKGKVKTVAAKASN